jgi:hypothetical protein
MAWIAAHHRALGIGLAVLVVLVACDALLPLAAGLRALRRARRQ